MEMVQKFWEAGAKASGAAKETSDKKSDGAQESRDNDEVRSGAEKPS